MACGLGSSAWESVSGAATMERGIAKWVPGEEGPVSRVWMAWPSSEVIWYDQLNGVQADIARLAKTIAKYTPVRMIVNGAQQAKKANTRIGRTLQPVTLLSHIVPDDMWMRDSGCVFRRNGQDGLECIKLNFNGWGRKQTHHNDARVADQMATYLGMPLIESLVVGEGGGVIQDGEGTLIANESSWVNENRNPGKSRLEIEAELLKVYGASKMIWLPGIAGQDITDDHIDGTFQFFAPGKLVVQMPDSDADDADDAWSMHVHAALAALRRATDAQGRKFSFVLMPSPNHGSAKKTSLLRSYVNYLVLPGAVVSVAFGDDVADVQARSNFQIMYPGRTVEMIRLDNIYAGGGGIHCVTQQQPLI
jgi:agmatine deiminase